MFPAIPEPKVALRRRALSVSNLTKRFGGLTAVDAVDLFVETGEIVSIIGPNGAGKTTLFNLITGIYRPTTGSIQFFDWELTGQKPSRIVELGIARTFQNIRLFSNMTVLENVLVGRHVRLRSQIAGPVLSLPSSRREEKDASLRAMEELDFVELLDQRNEVSSQLPYGWQRRLEIARALATEPRLLLLDEPAAGLNTAEKNAMKGLIHQIRARGITIILIEHDMKLVMDISDRVAVLDYGEKIAEGVPAEIQKDSKVIEAYLGISQPHDEEGAGA